MELVPAPVTDPSTSFLFIGLNVAVPSSRAWFLTLSPLSYLLSSHGNLSRSASGCLEQEVVLRFVQLFGWQTFKRVGASLTIHRVYKIVLVLSVTIQLGLFFMIVTVSLWIDQLYNGSIGRLAMLSNVYKLSFIIALLVSSFTVINRSCF
jgi:hypothetical protein